MSLGNNKKNLGYNSNIYTSLDSNGIPPTPIINPVLSGILIVGQTLNCTSGTWAGTIPITFGYTFIGSNDGGINFTVLQSSASPNYTLLTSDAGTLIRCNVIASNGFLPNGFAASNDVNILGTIFDIYNTDISDGYYLQLLRGAYYGSPCIRVRRSGDNAETNISFTTTGALDSANLLAFVIAGGGTQNGFITIWYSQKIGGNNLTQTNTSLQAQIVSSGVLITTGGNVTAQFAPNCTYNKTGTPLQTNYSIYQYNLYPNPVRHGDLTNAVSNTWPINWTVPATLGWRRETPLAYIQTGSLNIVFSKKCKVRNSFTLTLNISKVIIFTNTGGFSDTADLSFIGWVVPIFGATEGTTQQRGLIVYTTNHSKTIQDQIFDLMT